MIIHYATAAARLGHPSASHIVAYVADTRAEARRMLKTQLPRWLGPGLAGYIPPTAARARTATPPTTPACCAGSTPSTPPPTASRPWLSLWPVPASGT